MSEEFGFLRFNLTCYFINVKHKLLLSEGPSEERDLWNVMV